MGTVVSGYLGMTTSTTAPASCYLGRRRWTRCRSCSTGCREMALLPLEMASYHSKAPWPNIERPRCNGRAPPRSVPAVPRGPRPSGRPQCPRPSPLSLAHVPPRSTRRRPSSCVRRVQLQISLRHMFYLKIRGRQHYARAGRARGGGVLSLTRAPGRTGA